jgi:hypothetical protein
MGLSWFFRDVCATVPNGNQVMTAEQALERYRYYSRLASRPEATIAARRALQSMAAGCLRRAMRLAPAPIADASADAMAVVARS